MKSRQKNFILNKKNPRKTVRKPRQPLHTLNEVEKADISEQIQQCRKENEKEQKVICFNLIQTQKIAKNAYFNSISASVVQHRFKFIGHNNTAVLRYNSAKQNGD